MNHRGPSPPGALQQALNRALALHRTGNLAAAAQLYGDILQHHPREPNALRLLGVIRMQQGALDEAEDLIARSVKVNRRSADAHYFLGRVLWEKKNLDRAVACMNQCLSLDPAHELALVSLGSIWLAADKPRDAARCFEQAIARNANSSDAHLGRGKALHALARHDEAIASHRRAAALRPADPEPPYRIGLALNAMDRPEEALAAFDQAIERRRAFADALCGRAVALGRLDRLEESAAACEAAIALNRELYDAWYNYGVALLRLRRFADAAAACRKAIDLQPGAALAHYNCAQALAELKRYPEALAAYDAAIAADPELAGAYQGRAGLLLLFRRNQEAIADLERVYAKEPDAKFLLGSLILARQSLCDWTGRDALLGELAAGLDAGRLVAMPFDLLAIDPSAARQLACARGFVADKCPPATAPLWRGGRYAHERIRVAYLSADFRDHPVAYLMAGMLERHDRTRLQAFGISLAPREPSPMAARLERAFDTFIDCGDRPESDIAALLREREIDIAVDLMGHTREARTGVFAMRPCPIQASFVGFAGTMGAPYIDYLLADRIVAPADDRRHFVEKIVYLPDSFLPNDDTRAVAEVTPSRAAEGLPENGFVFCSFNQSYKITPEIFDCWMRLLREMDGSVLWLSRSPPETQAHLVQEAKARGIAAERLVFARWTERQEDHLARHRLADLFLDTPVFNAHSTAADALWAGLPVVTCLGSSFAGRVAASLLTAVGLPELVTSSLGEYESLASRIARDTALRAAIRDKLRRNRATHPLFDTARFTRHLEAAYLAMWERHQRGEAPESFAVGPIP